MHYMESDTFARLWLLTPYRLQERSVDVAGKNLQLESDPSDRHLIAGIASSEKQMTLICLLSNGLNKPDL
jgi:hypothetical protein